MATMSDRIDEQQPKVDGRLSDADFRTFREFYYRKTGNWFDDNKRYFVDKRLLERMRESGAESFRAYFTSLRFEASGRELQMLTNLMTVNETYFYREDYQLRCLVADILPQVLRHRSRTGPIRIWSLPCSTGEEPYSLAIYLLEHWPDIEHVDVEIVGSDIDTVALEKARAGRYGRRSLNGLPDAVRERYFEPDGPQHHRLVDWLRDAITFTRVNIADVRDTRAYRDFDVIFCRNLLIYFDEASRRKAAEQLFDALRPGGFICLGHSEFMSRISPLFTPRRFTDAIVYQRPENTR